MRFFLIKIACVGTKTFCPPPSPPWPENRPPLKSLPLLRYDYQVIIKVQIIGVQGTLRQGGGSGRSPGGGLVFALQGGGNFEGSGGGGRHTVTQNFLRRRRRRKN